MRARAAARADRAPRARAAITTACFFFGMLICVGLEWVVHKLHHRFSPSGLNNHDLASELPEDARPLPADEGKAGKEAMMLESGGSPDGSNNGDVAAAREPSGANHHLSQAELEERTQLGRMGAMTALAIALHNFPEGLATFLATVSDPSVGTRSAWRSRCTTSPRASALRCPFTTPPAPGRRASSGRSSPA